MKKISKKYKIIVLLNIVIIAVLAIINIVDKEVIIHDMQNSKKGRTYEGGQYTYTYIEQRSFGEPWIGETYGVSRNGYIEIEHIRNIKCEV